MDENEHEKKRQLGPLIWVPEWFLFVVLLAELAALLTAALNWTQRVIWAAIVAILWAGMQAVLIAFAVKGEPVSIAQVVTAIFRSVVSTALMFGVALLTVRSPTLTNKLAFGTAAAAMALNLAYLELLRRRISN
ncbi:MAG: hypothetical protein LUF86_01890 [Clostridiales bacterium]|nr:hypothetical protein [Clostridiales bacterium]